MATAVTVLYFASLREQIGREHDTAPVPPIGVSVRALQAILAEQDATVGQVFAATPRLRVAINQALATFENTVKPGDEVAFFPPMTGG
ncbi:molybdopterin converting factor subunit 1 [Acetobacter orientalis]|uniref:Molybdopterin synthase sulfur carrier subunit n=1 Tax=Acetobacter orientalis TaxID=146474 RepID=A0A0D6NLX6_9PROT|nr:molybdopterin converting factor subunit 1 [Acetobacter orientalis]GAN66635.1 molybdopterin converting factor small subunit MoeD [Acetobacter orientalis]GBR13443.1 molybdopterin converting factor small subunit MoeD [Acetobacter orientalis NRIC 0481]GEL60633.1 molybdopterin synthase sulfur carrier subunit [Acetobacter orientalis]